MVFYFSLLDWNGLRQVYIANDELHMDEYLLRHCIAGQVFSCAVTLRPYPGMRLMMMMMTTTTEDGYNEDHNGL